MCPNGQREIAWPTGATKLPRFPFPSVDLSCYYDSLSHGWGWGRRWAMANG
jgi:hypothetical protein